jgi:hypothetical protein
MSGGNVIRVPLAEAASGGAAAARQALRQFCRAGGGPQVRVGAIRSPVELRALWAIDCAAYGEASISFERFLEWWSAFPAGLHALFFGERILGALGLWPLSDAGADALKAGRLKEAGLSGALLGGCNKDHIAAVFRTI